MKLIPCILAAANVPAQEMGFASDGWLPVLADLAAGSAFIGIAVLLVFFLCRHPDVPFRPLFALVSLLIGIGGAEHVLDASTTWWPVPALALVLRIATAIAAWGTVLVILIVLPRALALPGYRDVVHRLEAEIADRRQRENILRNHSAELERRNVALDEFTYIASHDLQEPLRKIVSFSELLEQDLNRNDRAQAVKDLHFISDAAGRMRKLVRDLLMLSRAGRNDVGAERFALRESVDAALESIALTVQEHGANVLIDALPAVVGDRTLLTQLYQNLLSNAVKFVPADRQPCIHVTAERNADGWVFGIRDNGIGIDPAYHDQIFKAFKRLHGASEYSGNGIGLAICERAVTRHGGRIWVESFNGGSHFKFTLANVEEEVCTPTHQCALSSCS
ncbi:MAG TPA: ATP-binding protein [Phycisphaerae bacterium]|nr:ATP-binding protein [Phycisphaerae bacterium]